MCRTVYFLYAILCFFNCIKASIGTASEEFSYKEVRLSAKFSIASYNGPLKSKFLAKFQNKGWLCYDFNGKDVLGNSYKAGVIAFSPFIEGEKQKLVIAFRGTETIKDILVDFYLSQKKYHPFDRIGNIHQGFLYYFENSINEIKSLIIQYCFLNKKEILDFDIITTGHSLGGALATLTGIDLLWDKKFGLSNIDNISNPVIRTITFGTPKVGDCLFAQEYNKTFGVSNHLRFVFPGDLLPHIPFDYWGYQHVGKEIPLTNQNAPLVKSDWKQYFNKAIIETSLINHSMQNYFDKLKAYMKTTKPFSVEE